MSDCRWTIRGVGADIRQIVRDISDHTGRPACWLVSEAIQVFAENHPEMLGEHGSDNGAAYYAALADLGERIAIQGVLLQELTDRLTSSTESLSPVAGRCES
jgi:hypothetical protein